MNKETIIHRGNANSGRYRRGSGKGKTHNPNDKVVKNDKVVNKDKKSLLHKVGDVTMSLVRLTALLGPAAIAAYVTYDNYKRLNNHNKYNASVEQLRKINEDRKGRLGRYSY